MSLNTIAAVLFWLGAIGPAFWIRTSPSAHHADWMRAPFVPLLTNLIGLVAGWLAIYLLVYEQGWLSGLLMLVVTGFAGIFVVRQFVEFFYPLVILVSYVLVIAGAICLVLPSSPNFFAASVNGNGHTNANRDASKDAPNSPHNSVELGSLIRELMLPAGRHPDWSLNHLSGVDWDTSPRTRGYQKIRQGTINVDVMGKHFLVKVDNQYQLLDWNILLVASAANSSAPESVRLGNDRCFGRDYKNCYFELEESLSQAGITSKTICTVDSYRAGNGALLTELNSEGLQPAYLEYSRSAGSGGATANVTLRWNMTYDAISEACKPFSLP